MTDSRTVTTVLFDGFEPLDVFGPLELFGTLPDHFRLVLAGPDSDPVRSAHGTPVLPDVSYETAPPPDIVLVPGGRGTRPLVTDAAFLAWLARWAGAAGLVTSVCTGSGLLAARPARRVPGHVQQARLRLGREQGPRTEWVPQARWVEDRDRWTSSGVAAGMDMALALIARLHRPAAGPGGREPHRAGVARGRRLGPVRRRERPRPRLTSVPSDQRFGPAVRPGGSARRFGPAVRPGGSARLARRFGPAGPAVRPGWPADRRPSAG